jgi:hypothetical protein
MRAIAATEVSLAQGFYDVVVEKSVSGRVIQVEPVKNGENERLYDGLGENSAASLTLHHVKRRITLCGVGVVSAKVGLAMDEMAEAAFATFSGEQYRCDGSAVLWSIPCSQQ